MAISKLQLTKATLEPDSWAQAKDIFHTKVVSEEGDIAKVRQYLSDQTTASDALESCRKAKIRAEGEYSTGWVTIGGKKLFLREKIGKILKKVSLLVQYGDIAVQHSPETTSLIWAAFRMMLQVPIL